MHTEANNHQNSIDFLNNNNRSMYMDQTSSSGNHMNGSVDHLNGKKPMNDIQNGITGNGYGKVTLKPVVNGTTTGPLTNLSSMTSSTSSSLLTNNSFSSATYNKSNASSNATKSSPKMTPRNPVTGIGCNDSDSYRGRRRSGRGIFFFRTLWQFCCVTYKV